MPPACPTTLQTAFQLHHAASGLSPTQLSVLSGVSRSTIYAIERNPNYVTTRETLRRLAMGLASDRESFEVDVQRYGALLGELAKLAGFEDVVGQVDDERRKVGALAASRRRESGRRFPSRGPDRRNAEPAGPRTSSREPSVDVRSDRIVAGLRRSLRGIEDQIVVARDLDRDLAESLSSAIGGTKAWLEMLELELGIVEFEPELEPSEFRHVALGLFDQPPHTPEYFERQREYIEQQRKKKEYEDRFRRAIQDPARQRELLDNGLWPGDADSLAAWARGVDSDAEE